MLDIALLVCGIIALVKGRLQLTRNRVCRGTPARVAAILLIMAPVLGFSAEIGIGFYQGFTKGMEAAKTGGAKQLSQSEILRISLIAGGVHAGVMGVLTIVAFTIAFANGRPVRRRRVKEEYDDYDDRPRRRSSREAEDLDEDRPRRRRYDDGYDDTDRDDRPRRRRRYADDEDDRYR
jgi:hypothetical protein